VLVRQSTTLADGALVFALVGTQQVVRRLQGAGERRQLVSVNRYYGKIQVIDGSDDVALLGEVVGVMRVLRNSGESVVGGQ
jgi:SOS-response transcriptional repressor LexA